VPPPLLTACSIVSLQVGAACANRLFPLAGPAGAVALRLGFAAVILLVIWRPSWRLAPRTLLVVIAYGAVLSGMNILIYQAFARIPMGVAVTIEFIGPLAVAVLGSRRVIDFVWAALAAVGVILLSDVDGLGDRAGMLLALLAGILWGVYILMARKLGKHTSGGSGLALSLTVGALIAIPFGAVEAGTAMLRPTALIVGFAVAVMSSVVPYSLELEALRHIRPRVFGVLMSLEPAVAALAGLLILHQALTALQWVAVGCVVLASVGASRSSR
jgi:inner membrane transporter RhtA